MERSPSTHRTRTTRADALAGVPSSAASTVATSSREAGTRATPSTAVYIRKRYLIKGFHYPGGPGAGCREATPGGVVRRDHRAAAHLVNSPHPLVVGHEQQDGAVVDDDLDGALVVLYV